MKTIYAFGLGLILFSSPSMAGFFGNGGGSLTEEEKEDLRIGYCQCEAAVKSAKYQERFADNGVVGEEEKDMKKAVAAMTDELKKTYPHLDTKTCVLKGDYQVKSVQTRNARKWCAIVYRHFGNNRHLKVMGDTLLAW